MADSAILHVKTLIAGDNDANSGYDWVHAKASVTAANSAAQAGGEIWVAAGTYQKHIHVKSSVSLYGGFTGSEVMQDQRHFHVYHSILDGTNNGTVVTIEQVADRTHIDGFAIERGIRIVVSAPTRFQP